MIVADTSALLALFNTGDESHQAVTGFIENCTDTLVVSPFVIAELDYLVMTRLGVKAELAVLRELGGGAYDIPTVTTDDLKVCAGIIDQYRDHEIGITDASIVLLAKRFQTKSILTLDHRHFNVLRPLDRGRFTLLP
jgi:uncharacterized protein